MRRRIDRRFVPSQTTLQSTVGPDEGQATIPSPVKLDETAELAQVNVLYSFLENRYSNKVGFTLNPNQASIQLTGRSQYPLSEKFIKPASNPTYYTDLMKELEEAPKRSWLQSTINKWKGSLRFS